MNGKYALALILALQVSMSLCDIPPPSDELVEKYEGMMSVFFKRLINAASKLHAAAAPYLEEAIDRENSQKAIAFMEELLTKPEIKAIAKVAIGLGHEAYPMVDKVHTSVLGVYEHHLRPYVGESLNNGINHIKVFLDKYLPAE